MGSNPTLSANNYCDNCYLQPVVIDVIPPSPESMSGTTLISCGVDARINHVPVYEFVGPTRTTTFFDQTLREIQLLAGRQRFAKRKPASRTISVLRLNPSLSSTSQIERLGCCWLWRRRLGRHRDNRGDRFRRFSPFTVVPPHDSQNCPAASITIWLHEC
jgi:hypothetical protein